MSILEADLRAQQKQIDAIYRKIVQRKKRYTRDPAALESLAYQLHNLYCAFEDLFRIVANHFENQISDQTAWHKELLSRMKLRIEGVRPPLLSGPAHELLSELRGFRHLFRHAYGYELEPEKIKLVLKKALALKKIYKKDFASFLRQLTTKAKR
ncbi:MAG: hypothetical protein ONA90_02905 [candidate division KSB1 bacterium]|nr:hypothetical protein [candidate division KSB1 bacterium]